MAKKKRQKSKAAQATAASRQAREAAENARRPAKHRVDAEGIEVVKFEGGGGGMMSRMRGGFQDMAGQGGSAKKKGGWLSTAIWVGIGIAAALLIGSSFR